MSPKRPTSFNTAFVAIATTRPPGVSAKRILSRADGGKCLVIAGASGHAQRGADGGAICRQAGRGGSWAALISTFVKHSCRLLASPPAALAMLRAQLRGTAPTPHLAAGRGCICAHLPEGWALWALPGPAWHQCLPSWPAGLRAGKQNMEKGDKHCGKQHSGGSSLECKIRQAGWQACRGCPAGAQERQGARAPACLHTCTSTHPTPVLSGSTCAANFALLAVYSWAQKTRVSSGRGASLLRLAHIWAGVPSNSRPQPRLNRVSPACDGRRQQQAAVGRQGSRSSQSWVMQDCCYRLPAAAAGTCMLPARAAVCRRAGAALWRPYLGRGLWRQGSER